MKAAMILVISMMFGMSAAYAAEGHQHGATAGAAKVESLGGGKKCDKCKKDKTGAKGGMSGCCCAGKMGDMDHDAMAERVAKLEGQVETMMRMMEQAQKAR